METGLPSPPALPGPSDEVNLFLDRLPRRRSRHVTIPLLVPLCVLLAGAIARDLHAGRDVTVAGVVMACCVAVFARHKWDRPAEVAYACASAVAVAAWLAAAAFRGISMITLLALAVLGAGWGIPWHAHHRPRPSKADAVREWAQWWAYYAPAWDLGGSRIVDVQSRGVQEILRVQLRKGHQTVKSVTAITDRLESALGGYVRAGMTRVEQDRDDPSQALVYLKRDEPLKEPITWDETLVPASITEPAPVAKSEGTGEWVMLRLLERNLFVIGATRSGKSNRQSVHLATTTAVPDAVNWLIDIKGGRAARPWLPALDWVATTIEEARLMLTVLNAEVRARARDAYSGEEQLVPTPEVPAIFLWVDEAAEVTGMQNGDSVCAALLASISSMGLGVAIPVGVSTQYGALAESVRTEQTRSNLTRRICFAVSQPEHGAFALSDWRNLDASRLELAGSCYQQDGPRAHSAPLRDPEIPHRLAEQIARRNGARPRRPLVLYASEHQQAYDDRWGRLPETFRKLSPQYAAWAAKQEQPQPVPGRENPRSNVTISPAAPVSGYDDADDSPAAAAARIEADIAGTPDTPPPAVPDDVLRDEVERRKRRFARVLAQAPGEGVPPKRLMLASGMSRSWVMGQLKALCEAGAAVKVADGLYRGTPGADIWQAMEVIREGQDRLFAGVCGGDAQ